MSLNHVLQNVMRTKVPENVLSQCKTGDRQVVENILVITQETIPTLDITKSSLLHEGGAYHISVPSVNPRDKLRLREMMNIQAYSPARIQEIHIIQHNGVLVMHILIHDEASPITTSQLDIIRLCKKTKRVA